VSNHSTDALCTAVMLPLQLADVWGVVNGANCLPLLRSIHRLQVGAVQHAWWL